MNMQCSVKSEVARFQTCNVPLTFKRTSSGGDTSRMIVTPSGISTVSTRFGRFPPQVEGLLQKRTPGGDAGKGGTGDGAKKPGGKSGGDGGAGGGGWICIKRAITSPVSDARLIEVIKIYIAGRRIG